MSDDLEFARTRKRTPKPDQGEDNREKGEAIEQSIEQQIIYSKSVSRPFTWPLVSYFATPFV